MDFLASSAAKLKGQENLEALKRRKEELSHRLEVMRKEQFEIPVNNSGHEEPNLVADIIKVKQVLDTYHMLGVNIHSLGPDLVLTFSPTYRNNFHSSEQYMVQFLKNSDSYEIAKHNLPPFLQIQQIQEKFSGKPLPEYVDSVKQLLYAYVQRRDGLKFVKHTYKEKIEKEPEVNLAVTFVKFELNVSDKLPTVEITLQYSQDKCLPETVHIKFEDDETYSVAKKKMDQLVKKWTETLSACDIYTAVTDIINS